MALELEWEMPREERFEVVARRRAFLIQQCEMNSIWLTERLQAPYWFEPSELSDDVDLSDVVRKPARVFRR